MQQTADVVQGGVTLLARLMLAAVFATALQQKIQHFSTTADYMAAEGVPNPTFALFGAIGLILIGCVSLVAGAWTRIGALCLLVFLAAATFYFHDFWRLPDPSQRHLQWIQFTKNLAIGGGLLSLAAFGGGPWGVDGWIALKQEEAETTPRQRTAPKPP